MTGTVRTVLGDVDARTLGVTYCHEHLIIDSPLVADLIPDIHLPSVGEAVEEVRTCREAGVATMVDAMPEGGRDLDKLRAISRQTGVHIVAVTGLHTEKYYSYLPWAEEDSADQLARRFVADIDAGCGVIKAATGEGGMNARSRRLFEGVVIAHFETGAPIITHCEDGNGAFEQVELLSKLGVALDRVVLSHTDKVTDPGYHRKLLQSGVNLEYDQALRQARGEQSTARLLAEMIEDGYLGQLMLGTDGARRSLWRTLGGSPGLAYLILEFGEILEDHGVRENERQALFVDNPARWLARPTAEPPPRGRPR
jgi:predicted metal-dependent phosphotriesterase family hydrolase